MAANLCATACRIARGQREAPPEPQAGWSTFSTWIASASTSQLSPIGSDAPRSICGRSMRAHPGISRRRPSCSPTNNGAGARSRPRGRTQIGQLWAYARDDRPGVAGYRAMAGKGYVTPAFSWARLRCRFYERAIAEGSPITSEALQLIAALYRIETDIRGCGPGQAARRAPGAIASDRRRTRTLAARKALAFDPT